MSRFRLLSLRFWQTVVIKRIKVIRVLILKEYTFCPDYSRSFFNSSGVYKSIVDLVTDCRSSIDVFLHYYHYESPPLTTIFFFSLVFWTLDLPDSYYGSQRSSFFIDSNTSCLINRGFRHTWLKNVLIYWNGCLSQCVVSGVNSQLIYFL